ncbi:hypothetical protein ACTA71_007198 [Dictyostelium dimigraforme]
MGNKNSTLAINDGAESDQSIEIKLDEYEKDEQFITVVKEFVVVSKKIMKKENKKFLENQKEFLNLISETINESRYCRDVSKKISNDLINIKNNLMVVQGQIDSTISKSLASYQLNIDIENVLKMVDVGGKDQRNRLSKLEEIKIQLVKLVDKINAESDSLFYKKLFKFFRKEELIENNLKPINIGALCLCASSPAITVTLTITVGLSVIPVTIPISVFIIGCCFTFLYFLNRSKNIGTMYGEFVNSIQAISCQLSTFMSHLSIQSNDICENLRRSLSQLQNSEDQISIEVVAGIIKKIDSVLNKMESIQTLSTTLEEFLNKEKKRKTLKSSSEVVVSSTLTLSNKTIKK